MDHSGNIFVCGQFTDTLVLSTGALLATGNAYVTGEYSGSSPTFFGGIQIDDGGGGTFSAKYNSSGTVQWAKSLSTTGVGNGIATSGSDAVKNHALSASDDIFFSRGVEAAATIDVASAPRTCRRGSTGSRSGMAGTRRARG